MKKYYFCVYLREKSIDLNQIRIKAYTYYRIHFIRENASSLLHFLSVCHIPHFSLSIGTP